MVPSVVYVAMSVNEALEDPPDCQHRPGSQSERRRVHRARWSTGARYGQTRTPQDTHSLTKLHLSWSYASAPGFGTKRPPVRPSGHPIRPPLARGFTPASETGQT